MLEHVSASQIDMFARCPTQWYFRYVEGLKIAPGIALHVGSGVHGGAEMDLKNKLTTGEHESVGHVVDAAVAKFDEKLGKDGVYLADDEVTCAQQIIDDSRDEVAGLARLWREEVAPDIRPALIEESIRVNLDDIGIDLTGIIDLLEEGNVLRDLKTSKKRWSQTDADGATQPSIYRVLVKVKTGEYPSKIQYDVLLKHKKLEVQRIETERDDRDWLIAKRRIKAMRLQVNAGAFGPASPGHWVCSPKFCGYYVSACPYISPRQRILPRIQ